MQHVEPKFQKLFDAVDLDGSGRITARELQTVLWGQGERVSLEACFLLVGLFDEGRGSIDIQGFARLIVLILSWTGVFKAFDKDSSGFIDKRELIIALVKLYPKYNFDPHFVDMLVSRFGDPRRGGLTDDQFLFACAFVERFPPY